MDMPFFYSKMDTDVSLMNLFYYNGFPYTFTVKDDLTRSV